MGNEKCVHSLLPPSLSKISGPVVRVHQESPFSDVILRSPAGRGDEESLGL
jgi:hypothetical protein